MVTVDDLFRFGLALDEALPRLPWAWKGQLALEQWRIEQHHAASDMAMVKALGDLDSLDATLKSLTDAMRQELAGLSSQELGMIVDQTGDGVLALTYRSMAAEQLRARLG